MRIEQIVTLTDAREWIHRWGYIIVEHAGKLRVTNNGGPKREVTHDYNDLDHLKKWIWLYKDKEVDDLHENHPITESEES